MANKYTPRPQPAGKRSTAPKPHERRATGAYPYYRLATFSPVSLTYRDNHKPFDSLAEAKAAAKQPGQYRITIIGPDGIVGTEAFSV
jgi:hypothetical protein